MCVCRYMYLVSVYIATFFAFVQFSNNLIKCLPFRVGLEP